MTTVEDQFQHAMIGVYEGAKEHDYFATYFKRMLDELGGVETARRLLATREIQEGLMKLWDLRLLGQSTEALVVQERFKTLFTPAELGEAHRRLQELGYLK